MESTRRKTRIFQAEIAVIPPRGSAHQHYICYPLLSPWSSCKSSLTGGILRIWNQGNKSETMVLNQLNYSAVKGWDEGLTSIHEPSHGLVQPLPVTSYNSTKKHLFLFTFCPEQRSLLRLNCVSVYLSAFTTAYMLSEPHPLLYLGLRCWAVKRLF